MVPREVDLRRRILSIVEDYPGLHLRAIQRRAGCTAMVAEYHLNALEHLNLAHSQTQDSYRIFFPAKTGPLRLEQREKRWLALLRRPNVLGVVLVLLEHGPLTATEAAELTDLAGSTAYYQITSLRKDGLLRDVPGTSEITLTDPERVTAILQAYKPTRDAIARFGSAWSHVFDSRSAPPPPAASDIPPDIMDLPRSAQRVYVCLQAGRATQKEICERTGLARRTVYSALRALMTLDQIQETPRLSDTRTSWYSLDPHHGD